MKTVESKVTVIVSGVKIEKDFKFTRNLFDGRVSDINCIRDEESCCVKVNATITSEDENSNHVIAEEFVDYIHDLFCIFGVRVTILKWRITTGCDYLRCKVDFAPQSFVISGEEINKQVKKVEDNFLKDDVSGFFYNLKEAHGSIGAIHRFRSLFSIFDRLSRKKPNNSIDYNSMKEGYRLEIQKLYDEKEFLSKFNRYVEKLECAELIDNYGNNYSKRLKEARKNLTCNNYIDDNTAEYILRCIQVIRNRLNHGNFTGISDNIVNIGYELLLPYVQKLIKEKDNF